MWNKFGETKCHSNLYVGFNFLNQFLKKLKEKFVHSIFRTYFFLFYEIIIFISVQVRDLQVTSVYIKSMDFHVLEI